MLSITFQTAERADSVNFVKEAIVQQHFALLSFEGYTVKHSHVSLLLERGLFEIDCSSINSQELLDTLQAMPDFQLSAKIQFAQQLRCPFLFFCYSYINQHCSLYEIAHHSIQRVASFSSYHDFAQWTLPYRELVMTSRYEEQGLPQIDRELRKLKIPWPGNLDDVLLKNQTPTALIEFQRTTNTSVRAHCNNTWFLPTQRRKGDVNRWRALDIIRKQSGLPLLIIVWSEKEHVVKLKLVEEIIYPEDPEPQKGLRYKNKEVMTVQRMLEILHRF